MLQPAGDEKRRSARKPKGEGHARRAEILAAAERIFVEHGYEGATIRKIADEVGVSSAALYMHFAEKGAILLEICEAAFEKLRRANTEIVDLPIAPADKVRRMLEAYIAFGFANPNAYRLIYCTRPDEAGAGAQTVARDSGSQIYDRYRRVVSDVEAAGGLKAGRDAETVAQTMWAGAHGLVSIIITKPYFEWADRDELVRAMLDGLCDGLMAR